MPLTQSILSSESGSGHNMRHYSCSEILIVFFTITGAIGLVVYHEETQALGREAHADQIRVLASRHKLFKEAKEKLISSIVNHLNKPEFKEESINILSSKRRLKPILTFPQSKTKDDLKTITIFQKDIDAESISVLTAGAIVAHSTDETKIGRYQPVQNTTTYIDPQKSGTSRIRFFKDPLSGRPTTTLAFPIRDTLNNRRGYYAVDINPKTLYASMFTSERRHDLDPPEKTSAVAYTSLSDTTEIYNFKNAYPAIKSKGITNALGNSKGPYLYLNQEGKPVVGAYKYIQAANMALLVERDQSVVFYKSRQRLISILLLGSLGSLLAYKYLKWLQSTQCK